jgi:hypothetical protein
LIGERCHEGVEKLGREGERNFGVCVCVCVRREIEEESIDTCRREGILRSFRRVEHPVTTSQLLCRALVAAALQGLYSGEKERVRKG